jgi:hypothetical protein
MCCSSQLQEYPLCYLENLQTKIADRPASQVSSNCAGETTLPAAILAASRMASLTVPNNTFGRRKVYGSKEDSPPF